MSDINEAMQIAVQAHRDGNYQQAAHIYNQVLNANPSNAQVLYLTGDLCVRMGNNGLAVNLLSNSINLQPSREAYVALGCALKAEHFNDAAHDAWVKGLEIGPSAELYSNLASLYSDSGRPEKAIEWADKALALDPENPNAHWNRGLACLTARRWREGWIEHKHRFNPIVQKTSKRRTISPVEWDGKPVRKLAVHGEQGIGDEIMFMSVLHEAYSRCDELVVEVEPRLLDVVERSFPGARAYGNEDALKAHEKDFDAQIALGDLPSLFRNEDTDFPRVHHYLFADPDRVAYWRDQYRIKGPGPYIGVAWQGGSKGTRVHERTIRASDLDFTKAGTPISLQYGEGAKVDAEACGYHFFPESIGADMNEQFAMVEACDVIITVAQTVVHVAGSQGVPTYVLVPQQSSWRYGQRADMPWYGDHVKLLRQHKQGDWSHPLKRAAEVVQDLVKRNAQ